MSDTETVTIPPAEGAQGSQERPSKPTAADEAPWGYKDDGTPYKRDPSIYARRDANRARKASTPKRSKSKSKGPDYTDDVLGILQLVGVPLALAGTYDRAFLADVVALNEHAPNIASAVNDIALEDERVAAVLERLGKVGPYGMLLTAVTPLIAQMAVNHRVLAPGLLGTADPDALVASIIPPEQPPPNEPTYREPAPTNPEYGPAFA